MSAKLQLTRQQLAEFLKDPETIKVMERLLAIGNSIRDNIFSQAITITSNTTIGLLDHLVLIDTANAVTITIPEGCPIGHEIKITRLVASTNAVTVARSGTETIEGGATFITHGSTVASTLNNSEVVLKKISATSWQFVGGEIIGSNTNGSYVQYANGTMICYVKKQTRIPVGYVIYEGSWPKAFNSDYVVGSMSASEGINFIAGAKYTCTLAAPSSTAWKCWINSNHTAELGVTFTITGIGRWK